MVYELFVTHAAPPAPLRCPRYLTVLVAMTLFAFGTMVSYLVLIGDSVSVRGKIIACVVGA